MSKLNDVIEATQDCVQQILWQVQLREFPDSVRVPVQEVLTGWMYGDPPRTSQDLGEYRHQITRQIAMCLQYPFGVFYECGQDRQWRGFRFGTEGSEYLSGFGSY